MVVPNSKRLLCLGLCLILSYCRQSGGEGGACLKAVSDRPDKLEQRGEIGGQIFLSYDNQHPVNASENTQNLTESIRDNQFSDQDPRAFCNSYVEFAENESLEGTEAQIYVYTARHCIEESRLDGASIKLNTSKKVRGNSFKKTEYKEVPIKFDMVADFDHVRSAVSSDDFNKFYAAYVEFRSFGLADDMKKLSAMDFKKYQKISEMFVDLGKEDKQTGHFFCGSAKRMEFDGGSNQQVCMLPADLGLFRATIPITPEDKDNLKAAKAAQVKKHAEFTARLSESERLGLTHWMDYLKGLNGAAIDYAKRKTQRICGGDCLNYAAGIGTFQLQNGTVDDPIAQTEAEKIAADFDNEYLIHIENGLGEWNKIRKLLTYMDIYAQSNYDNRHLQSPQYLSFPLQRLSRNSDNPVMVNFQRYGITYESNEAAIHFEPGDSGTVISIGGHFPVAVISVVNGVKTSGGIGLKPLPPAKIADGTFGDQIEPPKSEPVAVTPGPIATPAPGSVARQTSPSPNAPSTGGIVSAPRGQTPSDTQYSPADEGVSTVSQDPLPNEGQGDVTAAERTSDAGTTSAASSTADEANSGVESGLRFSHELAENSSGC